MAIWTPPPHTIRIFRETGFGDLGSLTDISAPGRFSLRSVDLIEDGLCDVPVLLWTFVGFRLTFTGGTGSADLTLYIDDHAGVQWDFELGRWTGCGTDGAKSRIVHRVSAVEDLFALYTFEQDDFVVLSWTNPDAGVMRWQLAVMLAYVLLDKREGRRLPAGARVRL